MNCHCNGHKWEIKQKSLHLYFQNKILRSEVKLIPSQRRGGARSRLYRMTSSLTMGSPLAGAGGPLLPLPLLHQVRGARLAEEHLDTSTIQVTTPS